ncbi:MAG: HAD family hydrolase [Oceanospirillaceae bacterium]|nr:HAD family hydrolase [Oceanospirillaceae bacterium]
MIKVITFDLDDTLWSIGPVIENANQKMLEWMNQHAPKFGHTYDEAGINALRDEVMEAHPEMLHDLSKIRLTLIELGLSRSGYTNSLALAQQAYAVYFRSRNDVVLFDDTRVALKALKEKYQIGALTNGNADLTQVGINDLFDFYFNSAQLGLSKPNPAFFTMALEHTGHSAANFIHVGDHAGHDIAGAQAVGMRTIWMNPNNMAWPSGQKPACQEIQHLNQLSMAVANIHDS